MLSEKVKHRRNDTCQQDAIALAGARNSCARAEERRMVCEKSVRKACCCFSFHTSFANKPLEQMVKGVIYRGVGELLCPPVENKEAIYFHQTCTRTRALSKIVAVFFSEYFLFGLSLQLDEWKTRVANQTTETRCAEAALKRALDDLSVCAQTTAAATCRMEQSQQVELETLLTKKAHQSFQENKGKMLLQCTRYLLVQFAVGLLRSICYMSCDKDKGFITTQVHGCDVGVSCLKKLDVVEKKLVNVC